MSGQEFRSVFVRPGAGGWGAGLRIEPDRDKRFILSVTGGGIHPVAERIAELTGAEAVDGFSTSVPEEQVAAVVINCGGTARIGVYPRKRMLTVDVFPGEPGGPLAQYITEDVFVSDVGTECIEPVERTRPAGVDGGGDGEAGAAEGDEATGGPEAETAAPAAEAERRGRAGGLAGVTTAFGGVVGGIINTLLASGRQAIQLVLQTILPFMAYVSLLVGIVSYTGLSELIAAGVTPLAANPLGLVLLGVITGLPFLSPVLGPGAAIAQVVGVLMGTQIAAGALPIPYALPALFAINGQVGCDFVPVGLALGEAKQETIRVGVPAVLFSRLITSPAAVLIAWAVSFLLV